MSDIALKPSYWASVSGGKDSLYMLKLILTKPWKYPLNGVVHFEMDIDYPFIKDVIDYMESECKKYGIPFIRIKPRLDYFQLLELYGFPTRKVRWCNKIKQDCKLQLKEYLESLNCELVSYIGYCYDEVNRYSKRGNLNEVYPLVDEQINEIYILEWARTIPIFNDFYKFNRRCGCMYCPMQSRMSMAYLLKYYPLHYQFMMAAAMKKEEDMYLATGKKFSVWDAKTRYDTVYLDRVIHDKWLPILEEKISPAQISIWD